MERARAAVIYAAVAVLAVLCFYGVYNVANPPYSDQEIRASIVDTWEAQALVTFAVLTTIAVVTALSIAFAYGSAGWFVRRAVLLTVLLSLSSSVLVLYSHITLTERTAKLTGHTFGPLYGLF